MMIPSNFSCNGEFAFEERTCSSKITMDLNNPYSTPLVIAIDMLYMWHTAQMQVAFYLCSEGAVSMS